MDCYCNDYHDDGDHGAGRAILEMMEQYQITTKVVFVARFVNTQKLGADRIQAYMAAAASVINTFPQSTGNKLITVDNKWQGVPQQKEENHKRGCFPPKFAN